MTTEEIKNIVSIEQVLSLMYGLEVKKRMPCPIHGGMHNNFSLKDNFYHCFSCGAHGDIFTLVQEMSNVDFMEAKKLICEYFNLSPISKVQKKAYRQHLERMKHEQEVRQFLKQQRDYQQYKICQALRKIRTLDGNNFLEKHLENLLSKFEKDEIFFIKHDIHAHLNALFLRYNASKNEM